MLCQLSYMPLKIKLVPQAGVEPTTDRVGGGRSIQAELLRRNVWRKRRDLNSRAALLRPSAFEAAPLSRALTRFQNWRRKRESNPCAALLRPSRFQRAPIGLSGTSPCLAEDVGFEPTRRGTPDRSAFKTAALDLSANPPKMVR